MRGPRARLLIVLGAGLSTSLAALLALYVSAALTQAGRSQDSNQAPNAPEIEVDGKTQGKSGGESESVVSPEDPQDSLNAVEPEPPVEWVYLPAGRRDPFAPPQQVQVVVEQEEGQEVAREIELDPLQRVDVEDLKLVGILWDVLKPKAMMIGPDNKLHTVYPQTPVGRNQGYVAMIREGEVVVVEPYSNDGKKSYNTIIMELER